MTIRLLLTLAASFALTGCATPSNNPPASPSAAPSQVVASDSEGCEHLVSGPAKAVTANSPTMSVTPPEVGNDHARYDIQIPAFEGAHQGTVSFNSDEAGEYHFYLSEGVPFAVQGLGDAAATPEAAASSLASCEAVEGFHAVELGVGVYFLQFGPTTASSVGLVIEEASHAGHDHE